MTQHMTTPLRMLPLKLTMLLLVMLTAFQARTYGQCKDWARIGGNTSSDEQPMAFDGADVPYIATREPGSQKLTVKKYDGSSWVVVGSVGFSTSSVYYQTIKIDNSNTPYVAFADDAAGGITVMKFNGSSWVTVGSAGFSAGYASQISLAFNASGSPYVAFKDHSNGQKATVMKYNGSSWVNLGSAGITAGIADFPSIAVNNATGDVYLAFHNVAASEHASVMKYNGTSWSYVGSPDISGAAVTRATIAISSSGVPYVAYGVYELPSGIVVKTFDGSSWNTLGGTVLSGNTDGDLIVLGPGDVPYVVCVAEDYDWRIFVLKFDGSSWTQLGSIDAVSPQIPWLAVNSAGIPYLSDIGYSDYYGYEGFVKRFETISTTISGSSSLCLGATTTLSHPQGGGVWTPASNSVAAIGSATGIVAGVGGGIVNVSYTIGSCYATKTITVNPNTGIITGARSVNAGSSVTLSNIATGGSWSVSNANASINSSGVLTGITVGTTTVSYTVTGSCGTASDRLVVDVLPASGTACRDWVDGGQIVGAVASPLFRFGYNVKIAPDGTPYAIYTTYGGDTTFVSVKRFNGSEWTNVGGNVLPYSGDIGGWTDMTIDNSGVVYVVTQGHSWDSSHVYRYNGYYWEVLPTIPEFNADNIRVATDASGMLYCAYKDWLTQKITVIKYSGSHWDTVGVSAFSAGLSAAFLDFKISGATPYVLYDNQSNGGRLDVMKYNGTGWEFVGGPGVSAGAIGSGCALAVAGGGAPYVIFDGTVMKFDGSSWQYVSGLPYDFYPQNLAVDDTGAPYIGGVNETYKGSVLRFVDGSWQNFGSWGFTEDVYVNSIAISHDDGYVVFGSGGGAISAMRYAFKAGSLDPITGPASICTGSAVTLGETVTAGSWSSGNTDVATVGSATGVVTGVSGGTATISYSIGHSCVETHVVANTSTAGTINGPLSVQVGHTVTFSDNVSGGTWNVSNSNASISSSGVVTGVSAGTIMVSYSVTNSCGTFVTTVAVTVFTSLGSCSSWQTVGEPRFSDGLVMATNVTIDPAGRPYVVYTDMGHDFKAVVKRYNGAEWESVGLGVLPSIGETYHDIVTDSIGLPYVAYSDMSDGLKIRVKRFDGSSWNDVGAINARGSVDLAFDASGFLYCALQDEDNSSKATVKKFNGSSWENVGVAGFSVGGAYDMKIAFDGVIPYVVFADYANNAEATAMKFNGSNWELVGTSALSGGSSGVYSPNIALSPSGIPYVVYADLNNGGKATGKKFNGSSWVAVDAVLSAGYAGETLITINQDETIWVSYFDMSVPGLIVKKFDGVSWSDFLVPGGGWCSASTVDPTGIPYVAYQDPTTTEAKVTVQRYFASSSTSISGSATVCSGSSSTLTSSSAGGTWSSSNTAVATIGSSSGVVTGVSNGTTTISYTVSGCTASLVVTVSSSAGSVGAITGVLTVCTIATTTLANSTAGGTWSSSNASVAAVGSSTGVVTGVAAGNATITYTVTSGCGVATTTAVVTVNGSPSAGTITGTATVCAGNTTTLNNATSGGTWSTSNASVAAVGSATGILSGVAAGNATITYTVTNGCGSVTATQSVTVNATPSAGSITGAASVCAGNTTTLSHATAGGAWSSNNTSVATIGSATGVVSGVAPGNATVTYTLTNSCGSATATKAMTVNAATSAGAITGTGTICIGGVLSLSNATSGGAWSSSNAAVATVGSSTGVVTGISNGNATITYTVSGTCGTSTATAVVTVGTSASITGSFALCSGMTSSLSGGSTGGVWSSSNTAVATIGASNGILTAVGTGTSNITYATSSGCTATAVVTVSAPALIAGTSNACVGQTATLTDATTGGVWSSSNTSLATVDASTGVVSGIAAGATTVSYVVSAGCYRTIAFTVKALPPAIAAPVTVCEGSTVYVAPPSTNGYSWTSSNTSVAVIGSSTGMLTGIAAGTTTLTYTTNTGCFVTTEATVNTAPAAITGTTALCSGTTSTLSSVTTGGVWSSSNASVAAIGSATGTFTAGSAGTATISYTAGGCRTTTVVTVSAIAAITGTPSVCVGSSTALSNTSAGGTWSSSNTSIVTVGTSGILIGVAAGNATITYTLSTGCIRTVTATVVATPAGITGTLSICPSTTSALSGGTVGGTWSGGNASIATVNSSTGVLSGIGAGTINVSYTLTGCRVAAIATVNPLPAVITGTINACVAQTSTLNNATAGGAWTSNNTGIATVDPSTGVVTGVTAATTTITYTLGSGCYRATPFTVKAPPPAIAASVAACVGTTTYVAPPSTNGKSWSSSNTTVATMGSSTGIMTGVSTGTTILTYTATTGCYVTTEATVYALPNAGTITGPTSVVVGNTITLNDAAGGGVWSSGNVTRATIGSATGIVTGIAGGTATISYSVSNPGCTVRATQVISVLTSRPGGSGEFAVGSFQLYPNPTTGAFTVEVEEAGAFSIYSLDGREVSRHNISAGANQLALSKELASGIYMCRYTSETGNTTMVRLVYER